MPVFGSAQIPLISVPSGIPSSNGVQTADGGAPGVMTPRKTPIEVAAYTTLASDGSTATSATRVDGGNPVAPLPAMEW